MKKLLSFLAVVLISTAAFAQSVTLTFTAKDAANQHVQLNHVSITNLTKGWQETIYWPDTTLTMQNGTGISDFVGANDYSPLRLSQNNPNPFTGTTEVSLMVTNEGMVTMDIADINGRIVVANDYMLQSGPHQFRITLATVGTYVMTARQNGQTTSIKMICNVGTYANKMEYLGSVMANDYSPKPAKSDPRGNTTNPFTFGDQMEYVGYASINGIEAESQHIIQAQNASQTFVLQFAETQSLDGMPCPGTLTVTDIDNNIYNTVQIGNQCWMKENLRTTRYANGTSIPLGSTYSSTDPYRYYPYNDSSNVSTYGYLYNWPAVVGNTSSSSANPSGVQGICPTGWHVPSDTEWTQLTDYVSSQTQYQCDNYSENIAKALASDTGWIISSNTCAVGNNPSANNATGFSALPAGLYGDFWGYFGCTTYFWSATETNVINVYFRYLGCDYADVYRGNDNVKGYGFSVRCLRGEGVPTVTTTAVNDVTATTATCGGNVTSDGGATVTSCGVCWSTTALPTINDSHTTDGSGTGSFTSSITGLTPGIRYYIRAYATNSAGTAYGDQLFFTTPGIYDAQPCPEFATVTDIDNNTYNTVQIGNQCWMKENLRTTRYANGTNIALGSDTSTSTAYRYYPDNDSTNVFAYGYLYNWKAVMQISTSSNANPSGVQGICPTGWHVPSDAEWTQLTDYVSSQSQYVCGDNNIYIGKALASTTGWSSSSPTCTIGNSPISNNATGFSALPAGYYYGIHGVFGNGTTFWSATESYDNRAYRRNLYYYYATVSRNDNLKNDGYSVRCLRD